jgi:hypothetical protein
MRLPGRVVFVLSLTCIASAELLAQRDLIPPTDPVYAFLLRQQINGTLSGFHWGMLPLSRTEIAGFLDSLAGSNSLSATDRGILRDLQVRLSYDRTSSLSGSTSILGPGALTSLFDDERQKYIYAYADSSSSIFVDGFGSYSYRAGKGDSVGSNFVSLGEIGLRVRGTLFDRLGFYLQASNGKLLGGSHQFALTDTRLVANDKFNADARGYFDFTNGYMRYDTGWLTLMVGREQVLWGTGYSDRLIFSDNTVPFDYVKLDIRSGNLRYSFLHGSLVGADTNGHTLSSKYIASHRLEFNIGSRFRLGLNEAIVYSRQPPSLALMNPLAFLTSTDQSIQLPVDNSHKKHIWIDAEVLPVRKVRLSGTLMIDDLDFGTLGHSDVSGNDNKFAWQGGALWQDAFSVEDLRLSLEYTRIGPFVGAHREIVSTYTNWGLSLGQALQPNSDDWTLMTEYYATSRMSLSGKFQFQRTGENIVDASGNILFNAGSDLLHGEGDFDHPNVFLQGLRVNRFLATVAATWQPVRQYFIELTYFYRSFDYPSESRSLHDSILWSTLRVDF